MSHLSSTRRSRGRAFKKPLRIGALLVASLLLLYGCAEEDEEDLIADVCAKLPAQTYCYPEGCQGWLRGKELCAEAHGCERHVAPYLRCLRAKGAECVQHFFLAPECETERVALESCASLVHKDICSSACVGRLGQLQFGCHDEGCLCFTGQFGDPSSTVNFPKEPCGVTLLQNAIKFCPLSSGG